ncbi:hypothetical protein E2C01_069807 [Portunus trituberculatus]|uniref:Uncharacterized protein n=1 Tax=Portunus trituberculatus TaxID=210409 RepID=A0A5B7HSI5_PORTR|nr:hypothetical protein [Portunus trituberculatus]
MNKILRSKAPTTGHPSVHGRVKKSGQCGQNKVCPLEMKAQGRESQVGMSHRCYGQKNRLLSDLGIAARRVTGMCPAKDNINNSSSSTLRDHRVLSSFAAQGTVKSASFHRRERLA